jgi:hypothetical protein
MQKQLNPPTSVTILAIIVLFITSWFGIRIYSTITNWQILIEFGARPVYILGTGAFWFLIGLWLFSIIGLQKPYTPQAGSVIAVMYVLWYWIDRLVMQSSPAPNVSFNLIISTFSLAIFIIILNLPVSRSFFNKE